jgi:hypothetical protein
MTSRERQQKTLKRLFFGTKLAPRRVFRLAFLGIAVLHAVANAVVRSTQARSSWLGLRHVAQG